ncbi:I78 family peptidase inhibitor [Pseudoxanthomonas dokdonensis]|uniref:Peptidase inhibitor I78 family protein n=1 Tax=Pseudoxanthomonas dokdonensis TaxID=344882 RepID=A0A0R0CPV0_9GAMM|nr:I78 family peptidase inhibitor [Pseudoxanthomonas dokdonensis]KRG72012.1 Elastase inhibitor AFLEI Flags: Precursor [Pseudoxanthomonas dokdonensis]
MPRIALISLPLLLALTACGSPHPDEQAAAVARSQAAAEAAAEPADPALAAPAVDGSCDETQAQWVIGKTMDDAQLEQARGDAGAETVRSLKPNQVITMEYNGNRLNIDVDAKGVATAARCG